MFPEAGRHGKTKAIRLKDRAVKSYKLLFDTESGKTLSVSVILSEAKDL